MSTRTADDHLRRADELRSAHHSEEALEWFARALLAEPDHRAGLLGLGATLLELGRVEEAERTFERAARLFPDDPEALAALAAVGGDVSGNVGSSRAREADDHAIASPAALVPTRIAADRADNHSSRPVLRGRPPMDRAGAAVRARRAPRADWHRATYSQAKIVGLAVFPAVVACYVLVGLRTHFAVGLAAAALCALTLSATTSLFFAPPRLQVAKGALHGMLWGVGVVAIAGLVSLLIAVSRAATDAPW